MVKAGPSFLKHSTASDVARRHRSSLQEPGAAEEDFAKVETSKLLKGFLSSRDPRPPCLPKEIGFSGLLNNTPVDLPSWLTEEDINFYGHKFSEKGFTGGLNYYRASDLYGLLQPILL